MRLDHIAYRTNSRDKTVDFFIKAFGYTVQAEFEIYFNDEKTDKALCIALEPPEKTMKDLPWTHMVGDVEYHLAPEIFVSEGTPGSIVGEWVKNRGGIGGVHHFAYQVDSVEQKMQEWKAKGFAEFTSEEPMKCPGLTQVFSRPSLVTGVIYEFIEREEQGFCAENVVELMRSTANADTNMK